MSALNVDREFDQIIEHWSPRVVADANGQSVKLAKLKGEFVWHDHAEEDEIFIVWRGALTIRYRDRDDVHLREGDVHVVPRGVQHFPVADEECWVMLVEPAETKHTGDVVAEQTKSVDEQRAHLARRDA